MIANREHRVAETCVALTDSSVSGHDALDRMAMLVEGAVVMLNVNAAAASVLLDEVPRGPEVFGTRTSGAASARRLRRLEVFAVAIDHEPGESPVHIGQSETLEVAAPGSLGRRPGPGGARSGGFAGVHALPMRLRDRTLGALTLLHAVPGTVLPEDEVRLGQALADAATIGLMHERAVRDPHTLVEDLQQAMVNRAGIERAAGVIAHRGDITPVQALDVLRSYSRIHELRLSDVAGEVVAGRLDLP